MDKVAEGDMVNDAGVGRRWDEAGTRVVVRGNGVFVRAKEPRDVR